MASIAEHIETQEEYRFSPAQRLIHWLMAAVIIAALGLGLYCSYLQPGTPLRQFLMDIHKSLGMTALVLLVIRLPLRLSLGEPAFRKPLGRLLSLASHAGHFALYGLMILMPFSGYTTSAAGGHDLPWFGLFHWPNVVPASKALDHLAGAVHKLGAYAFFAVLGIHIAAALWHHFVRKDEVLGRMM